MRPFLLGGVALLSLLATACVTDGAEAPIPPEPMALPVGRSLSGNYLAGRHAQMEHRLDVAADSLKKALAKDPENPDLLRRSFAVSAAEGRFPDAIDLARRMAAKDPKDPLATYVLVAEDIRAGRFDEAGKRMDAAPPSGIGAFIAPLLKGWALAGAGKTDQALAAVEEMTRIEGLRPLRDLHAALINDLAGRDAAAEKDYRAVLAGQSELTLRLAELMGGFLERIGKRDEAKALYGRYVAQSGGRHLGPALARLAGGKVPPRDVNDVRAGAAEALFGIASTLRQQNAREMALLFAQLSLYLRPDYPVAQLLLASLLEATERLDEANRVFGSVARTSPFSWSARLRQATNLDSMDRTDEAVAILEGMATEDPKDPDPYIDMGDVLRGRERYAEAVQAYDKAVARIGQPEAKHWGILYARGIALERSQQWPRAEADFLKALEFKPDQPSVLNYLGYSWVEKGKHLDKAQEMLRKAVQLKPHDGYIVDSLGWVYYRLGNYQAAVKELERAVELKPADPVINDHLGDAYWKVGRLQEARFQWRRSLGLNPEPDGKVATERKLQEGLADEPAAQPPKDKNG